MDTNAHGFGNNQAFTVPGGDVESLGGKTGVNSPVGSSAPFGVGGLYGQGRYDYSINADTDNGLTLGSAVEVGSETGVAASTASANYKDLNFNQEFSASLGNMVKVVFDAVTNNAKFDGKAVRAVQVTSGSEAVVAHLPQFSKFDESTGKVTLIISASSMANLTGDSIKVSLPLQPTEADRGDFEDTDGDASNSTTLGIPEVDLQLKSQAIVAKTRKLKAVWSPELAQDLNAYHSVDAEAELTSMLSEYISMEIDLEILDMLMTDAVTEEFWSATPGEDYDGAGSSESDWNITTFYGTRYEWYQTLLGKIQKVSNEIQRLTLRGGANFVVVSPTVATILESIPGYSVNTDGNKSQFAAGVQVAGSLQNRFTVYKNPYMTENKILVGFRGSNFLETGAVYSPYVPLIMTPLVYDPSDFTPRKGVMTRYAKKMIRPEFYGKIHCKDLNLV